MFIEKYDEDLITNLKNCVPSSLLMRKAAERLEELVKELNAIKIDMLRINIAKKTEHLLIED